MQHRPLEPGGDSLLTVGTWQTENKKQLQVPAPGAASPIALWGPGECLHAKGPDHPHQAEGMQVWLQSRPVAGNSLTRLEEEAFKNAKASVRQQMPQMLNSSSSGPG